MTVEDYKKLEKKITGNSFNESYKNINKVLTFLSYFGHVSSIFLAYFMLSGVLSTAITNVVVVGIVSVAGLGLVAKSIAKRKKYFN